MASPSVPEHKSSILSIVLQNTGHFVAMTVMGVNEPALKKSTAALLFR